MSGDPGTHAAGVGGSSGGADRHPSPGPRAGRLALERSSTLAFLTYVARRRDWARLLVLGTYRPVEILRQAHPLRRMIAELRQHRQCVMQR